MPTTSLRSFPYAQANNGTRNPTSHANLIDGASQLDVSTLANLIGPYLFDCELRLYSAHTLTTRRIFLRNLLWFLNHRNFKTCGTPELRQFFHYLLHGHEEVGGRFGNPQLTQPVRPITVKDYYLALRSLFDWLATQGIISSTPFVFIPKPQVREEAKPALTKEQLQALFSAALESTTPQRNMAILWFLLDTGCRVSEITSIEVQDLDLTNQCCQVLGKGNKYRTVYFGTRTAQALRTYLMETNRFQNEKKDIASVSLFLTDDLSKVLTVRGVQLLLKRLKKKSGIKASCSPHAWRRSFAVQTLKNGANVFSVQAMLGHTNLQMTQMYCRLAQADVETQHRKFGPVDQL